MKLSVIVVSAFFSLDVLGVQTMPNKVAEILEILRSACKKQEGLSLSLELTYALNAELSYLHAMDRANTERSKLERNLADKAIEELRLFIR
jgi:hypothetical protein